MIYQDTSDSNFEGETAKPTWSIVMLDGIQITSGFAMLKGEGLLGAGRLHLCGCCSPNSAASRAGPSRQRGISWMVEVIVIVITIILTANEIT